MASVHRLTGESRFLRAAGKAAAFVLARMTGPDGGFRHIWAGGEARVPAFLDDHAFLIKGFLALYEAGHDPAHLKAGADLARRTVDRFWDGTQGGFVFAADPEAGPRRREAADGAVPSGNSVMLANLVRLSRLTGCPEFGDRAARTAEAFAADVSGHPRAHTEFLCGLDLAWSASREIVVTGRRTEDGTRRMLEAVRRTYLPDAVVLFKPADDPEAVRALAKLAPFTADMGTGGAAAAYVCADGACLRPVTSAAELVEALRP